MDTPTILVYTGMLMAVSAGLTAWRVVSVKGRITLATDRALAACLITSVCLFVAFLLPHYVPGIRVP